LFIKFLSKK